MGSTLFCFVVASAANIENPHEEALLNSAKAQHSGIYSCDGSAVYWGPAAPRDTWNAIIANVDIFADIWRKVQQAGDYRNFHWTVKADPDTVFFPHRLKQHIAELHVPDWAPVYLQNCDFKFNFQGSFEVVSRDALEMYLQNQDICLKHIGNGGGEDAFFKSCMDALGVRYMQDFELLNDGDTWNTTFEASDVSFCGTTRRVAYHPLKSVDLWSKCFHKALAAESL